jgi:hypothetical protein
VYIIHVARYRKQDLKHFIFPINHRIAISIAAYFLEVGSKQRTPNDMNRYIGKLDKRFVYNIVDNCASTCTYLYI